MKKLILSGFVVAAFIVYAFKAHHDQQEVNVSPATPAASNGGSTGSQPAAPVGSITYKDGTYTGNVADAFYGNVQVQATVSGGKITDVAFLQYPGDRSTSVRINSQAMPMLKQEAIQAQSAQVDGVSGATDTSKAFIESLSSALNQAKA